MRKTHLFLFLIMLAACRNKQAADKASTSSPQVAVPIDTAAFLNLFPEVEIDSVFLSTGIDSNGYYKDFMWGTAIDTIYKGLFSKFSTEGKHYSYYEFQADSTYSYALGKFNIGHYTGLLVRHPGMYSSTCVTLFFYDKLTGALHNSCYWITESWGDAGDYLAFDTKFKRINDSTVTVFIYKVENGPDDTDTTGNRYINLDSTLTYELVNTTMALKNAVENRQWISEPFKEEEVNNE